MNKQTVQESQLIDSKQNGFESKNVAGKIAEKVCTFL